MNIHFWQAKELLEELGLDAEQDAVEAMHNKARGEFIAAYVPFGPWPNELPAHCYENEVLRALIIDAAVDLGVSLGELPLNSCPGMHIIRDCIKAHGLKATQAAIDQAGGAWHAVQDLAEGWLGEWPSLQAYLDTLATKKNVATAVQEGLIINRDGDVFQT